VELAATSTLLLIVVNMTHVPSQLRQVWLDEELMKTYAGRGSPGPCTYTTPGGIGKQPDSKYSSQPSWKQGTSERFQ
jgi:hypothetical protein